MSTSQEHKIIILGVLAFFAVGFIFLMAGKLKPPGAAHASGSWLYYRSITVTSTASVASGTNINFPMLVSSTFTSWEPVFSAISVDATSTSGDHAGVTNIQWTHVVTSTVGANTILLVAITTASGATTTAVSYGGTPLAKLAGKQNTGTSVEEASIWYLVNPASGSNTISATGTVSSGRMTGYAISLTGVNQTTPIDATGTAAGVISTSGVSSTLSHSGDFVLDVIVNGSSSLPAANSGQSVLSSDNETIYHSIAGYLSLGPSGNTSTTYTMSGASQAWSQADVAVEPALAGSGHIQNLCTAPNGSQEPCDLVFATSTANCTAGSYLNFETESYSSSTGAIDDWVDVPSLSTGSIIYACYDNSSITTDQSHPSSTWNSNYVGVWHFASQNGTTTPSMIDSTANANNGSFGTTSGHVTSTQGLIDGSVVSTGTSSGVNVGNGSSISCLQLPMTLSMWVNEKAFGGGVNDTLFAQDNGTTASYTCAKYLQFQNTNEVSYFMPLGTSTQRFNDTTLLSTSTWYNYTIVTSGSTSSPSLAIYVNGVRQNFTPAAFSPATTSVNTYIGAFSLANTPVIGQFDEAELSNTALSSQWVTTEYNNQANPAAFYSVGSETSLGGGGGISGADTWVSTSNNNWNTAGNWSTGAVPGSTSTALFSSSSTVNCNINAAINVAGINITSGYTGTITQNSGESMTVGTSSWTQSGGTFTGSSASTTNDAITVNGAYALTGGIFTSTAGNLTIAASSTMSGSTFNNNSGTVIFTAATSTNPAVITGSATFYNLWLGNGGIYVNSSLTVATGTVLTSQNTLFFNTYTQNGSAPVFVQLLGGGTIDIQGNVGAGEYMGYATSTVSFIVNGTGSQTLGETATCVAAGYTQTDCSTVFFPNLTITKTSGSMTLANYIDLAGNWTNTNATTINPGTSTVYFGSGDGEGVNNFYYLRTYESWPQTPTTTYAITGSSTFYNLGIGNELTANSIATIATGTVLTVQGYYSPITSDGNYSQLLGGGQIDVQGDIQAGILPGYATSTVSIIVDGTGTQMLGADDVDCGSLCDSIELPNLNIAKAAGVAYLTSVGNPNSFLIQGSTTISSGELSLSTSSNPISAFFYGPLTVNSGAVLSDYPPLAASSTIQLGSSVTNNGLIFFDGSSLACAIPLPDNVILESTTTGSQIPWSGSGNFIIRYTSVADQGGTATIPVWGGAKSGSDVGSNWTFPSEPEPELIQTSTASGGTGTTNLSLPAFSFKPRAGDLIIVAVSARNQTISAPTDNASNTYTLVASSSFGSSPSYSLSLYYAKSIATTSSLAVTVSGGGGSGQFLSASAFEYTGITPSSTFDKYTSNTDTSGSATTLTSFSASGQSVNELYFGALTFAISTTATSGSGWTTEVGVVNNSTLQALYDEDVASSSQLTTAATWTSVASTSYTAMMGIFHSPHQSAYVASGTLDSATFDTQVASGTQLNSFIWEGSAPSNSSVKFQFAVSNSSSGPWNFEGPDGTINTYFSGGAGTPISLLSTNNGYTLFNDYRYFRYRTTLFADSADVYTPTVTQVSVNWSP